MKLILNNNNKLKKNMIEKKELSNKLKQDLLGNLQNLFDKLKVFMADKTIKRTCGRIRS
ncbi:hypothetical protein [Enterococcus faecium]